MIPLNSPGNIFISQLRIEAQMGNTMGQTLIEARKGTLSSSAKVQIYIIKNDCFDQIK